MNRISGLTQTFLVLACCMMAAGCATTSSNGPPYSSGYANYGTIQSIEQLPSSGGSAVVGTVAGAAVGGVIGHQFGAGRGNDIATVAGAIGGAFVGHEIQERAQERQGTQNSYRIQVRMRGGSLRTFTEGDASNLSVGQVVRIEGDHIQV